MGRLILPDVTERSQVDGVYFEVHHAPKSYQDLVGKKVYLRYSDRPDLQAYVNQVKTSIDFSHQAYKTVNQGIVHPTRLNHWRQVQALESLAGARPNWQGVKHKKGQIDSILLNPRNLPETELVNSFTEGDRLLLLHTFGGIGGNKRKFAPLGIFFGHFAFGLARVIREPLTQDLRFKIAYAQVYTQNTVGIIAGSLDWTNYTGDRQIRQLI